MNEFLQKHSGAFALFAPFLMALGMASYFAASSEPNFHYPFIIAALCAINFFLMWKSRDRDNIAPSIVACAVLLFMFGFFYACGYSRAINTQMLRYDQRGIEATATVRAMDYGEKTNRVYLSNINDMGLNARVNIGEATLRPGDKVKMIAFLFRPRPADARAGFDLAEWAYFKGIGATGVAFDIEVIESAKITGMERLRSIIHEKIAANTSNMALALPDALIIGYQGSLPKEDGVVIRSAGIWHVFSISGYHITLIGGWLFLFFYLFFRSVPGLTKRIPARYPAQVFAWAMLFGYLMISGAGVATLRAFLMASMVFVALFLGRTAITMRNAALCFGAILLLNPHYVMEPSFQLSFSAIFGLLYYFKKQRIKTRGLLKKLWLAIKVILMTSLVASILTTPFIAYHFNVLQNYSILGNLLCIPIFSLLIMPLVLIGTITAMFGFVFPLEWAAWFYSIVLHICGWIHNLPASNIFIPVVPGISLAMFVIAGAMYIFLDGKKERVVAIWIACTSVLPIVLRPRPIFYATVDRELSAYRRDDGTLQFNRGRDKKHQFAFDTWNAMNKRQQNPEDRKSIRSGFKGKRYSAECAYGACIYKTPKFTIAYVQKFMPLASNIQELCADPTVKYIVPYFKMEYPACEHKILRGGMVIYKHGTVVRTPDNRPWHK